MKIEKIELNGFKSFADRTVFNLHKGITCIVGPNGCGKSNVVDAFRWVLGEQSAKTLRGGKMEEVIFNGSSTKNPKGMSDVTLHMSEIDGSSDGNGGSGKGITVSRRLYRSGDSEYMINRNICRLRDVKDLFLDTGLEVKSYSIIEQGHIDSILNSKPLDRRFIIEEVAGVMKYKVRKEEAQRKLESSRLNLQRINDVITEVNKQIKTLDRLARKAERYKAISDELKEIELKINKKEYTELKEVLERTDTEYEEAKEQEAAFRASLSTKEVEYQKIKIDTIETEKELQSLNEGFLALQRSVSELNQNIAVYNKEVENASHNSQRISTRLTDLDEKRNTLEARISLLGSEKEQLSSQFEDFSSSVSRKKDFISDIDRQISEKEYSIEERRKDIFDITEKLSSLNNDLARYRAAIESSSKKEEAQSREMEETSDAISAVEAKISSVESEVVAKNNDLALANEQKQVTSDTISDTQNRIGEQQNRVSALKEELASDSSRLTSLREISLEGVPADMLSSDALHVTGVISDVMKVDSRYERAIESVLSDRINGLIMSSYDDAETAARHIRENGLSRTALMILDDDASSDTAIPTHLSVKGRASDFVDTDSKYAKLIGKLLGNVVITEDLRSAYDLSGKNRGLIFVTPEGDIIDRSRTILSGHGKDILKRKREIRELADMIERKKDELTKAENDLSGLKELLSESEKKLTGIGDRITAVEKEVSIHKVEIQNLEQEKERLSRKRSTINLEMEQTRQEKESVIKTVDETISMISDRTAKKEEMEAGLANLQKELTEKKEFYEKHRDDLTGIQLEITRYKEKIDSISKEMGSVSSSIEEIERTRSDLEAEVESNQFLIEQKNRAVVDFEKSQKEKVLRIDSLRTDISSRKEDIEGRTSRLNEMERDISDARKKIESVSERASSADVARTEYRLRSENIFNNMIQKYGINIEHHDAEPPSEEEMEKLPGLREKIQSIGPVNLGTIEEYEELKERYEFLSTQQKDLSQSIDELEEAIRKINYTTRKRLREAFTQLDQKFSEVFMRLFGGGKANLVLTDDQNILESGIDIIAQPPGKKLQNITLLSGGEKALTAISLIFGGFLIKPAPICILDEADAPLDESNSGKYAAMLKELSEDIQLVVITHNRTTMEAADHIYGVTMEEPGASKIISMQLAEV
ncbi:MAG: chromosome segregation protein SMC [Nitrospirota bacterium]|nr:MAG: chromosome segregation protein SMC [Nitrospirota bacterium]